MRAGRRMMWLHRRQRSAFTLIELLVVISITGVLLSILMPALSSARRSAKSAICLTRLRTAGQGLVLYANDSHDTLPPARMPKLDDDKGVWIQLPIPGQRPLAR